MVLEYSYIIVKQNQVLLPSLYEALNISHETFRWV